MASLIPSLNNCLSRMQAGEKRFARRLESHLEDDYICWYELPVGRRQRYTDFIILHPLRGLLLLEVKDWKLESIREFNKESVTLLTANGLKTTANPIEQARQCTYQLTSRLQKDPQLIHSSGKYLGNLIFPYGYGVVLSNITRQQFEKTDLGDVLPEHRVICKDEMLESVDPEVFQERLWQMFDYQFNQPLTLPQIDRMRWHIFPEIRIDASNQADLFSTEEDDSLEIIIPDIVKVMDKQQEQLARNLGEGHRVIHGVAGSGKTLILGYRCLYLAKVLNKPILVLCYNITLAARLRSLIEERDLSHKVNIYHFHDWCGEQLRSYHIDKPVYAKNYTEKLVATVIDSVDQGRIPRAQYGAVMIDEGHDFEPDWLSLVVKMVDPETNSLLLLYDDAQSIYNKKNQLDFSLSSVGIQARGRTTVLKLNYRNTEEILTFAYNFACYYFKPKEIDDDHVPLIEPEAVGRHGSQPAIKCFESYSDEVGYISRIFQRLHNEQGFLWSDMCVTYSQNWMGKALDKAFRDMQIPVQWLSDAKAKKQFNTTENTVKLMTMHSSKGLEFPIVAVSGVGYIPGNHMSAVEGAKLLYVAMTRSTDKLLLTSDKENEYFQRMK